VHRRTAAVTLLLFCLLAACGDDPPPAITFGAPGSTSADSGRGSFTFGAATAATQIEDDNPNVDWYVWTAPEPDGLARGPFVGDAVEGYSRAIDDIDLIEEMNLDSYRFSIEWARVEPQRDQVDETALAHYDDFIDELVARGIEPMVTIHHFSNPLWVDDPRIGGCPDGVTDDYLCDWHYEDGAAAIIEEIAEHARMLGARYGDRVDDWCTVNEPINYLVASYGVGFFPPGRSLLLSDFPRFMNVVRAYIDAHVAIYQALKESDTVDADGDGVAASVGFTLNVAEWVAARDNQVSDDPEDVAARDRVKYAYHYVMVDSLLGGTFDSDLDGTADEDQPDWTGKLDWLGVQYYSKISVSADRAILPGVDAMVCFGGFDLGSCVFPDDDTKWVPAMGYEYYEPGIYNVLTDFASRWPDLPLTVTESGLATEVGARRAEHIVRSLEQIARARDDGADVRGYYHWSLTDNFEWAEGYEPRFGLYRVDLDSYDRTATDGATMLGDIAAAREVSSELRASHGGTGPMTPETE
jgi:beta-glucosidase